MKHRNGWIAALLAFVLAFGIAPARVLASIQSEDPPEDNPQGEEQEQSPAPDEEQPPEEEPPPSPEEPQQQTAQPQQPPRALPLPPQTPTGQPVPPQPPPTPVPAPPAATSVTSPHPEAPGAAAPEPVSRSTVVPTPASKVDGAIAKIQKRLRAGAIGLDPVGARAMDLVDRGEATAQDFNAFAVYLAKKNFIKDAEAYAKIAVKMDKTDRDSWLNLGTIRLQLNKLSSSLVAYEKAKSLDPNYGLTWYSIGVVHDYMRNYDKAVRSYTIALALDPALGDARKNPQVVNNERLLVVNLLIYQAKEGGLAMPLRGGPKEEKTSPTPSSDNKTPTK